MLIRGGHLIEVVTKAGLTALILYIDHEIVIKTLPSDYSNQWGLIYGSSMMASVTLFCWDVIVGVI